MSDITERDTAWMREHLKHACQRLGHTEDASEYIADEFAPWAAGYLARRVTHEIAWAADVKHTAA